MENEKKAKKVYTLDEIKFNPDNLTMSVVACIPFVALVLMFVEKKDLFVRYHASQFAFLNLIYIIFFLTPIPVIGPMIVSLVGLASLVLFVLGLIKTSKGERFDIPFLSDFALKIMSELG